MCFYIKYGSSFWLCFFKSVLSHGQISYIAVDIDTLSCLTTLAVCASFKGRNASLTPDQYKCMTCIKQIHRGWGAYMCKMTLHFSPHGNTNITAHVVTIIKQERFGLTLSLLCCCVILNGQTLVLRFALCILPVPGH